jgi:pimeloyl-ACP methyl ester carboxylesterase
MDLRGHGNSGKPWTAEAYKDTAIWAEDVRRVMAATGLVKPVLLGWSYGTLVTADYVRHVGTGNLSGIVLVGALGGFTPPPAASLEPKAVAAMASNRARAASPNLEEFFAATHVTLPQLVGHDMPADWQERTLMMMAMLPPYVRAHMWLRNTNNTDIVDRLVDVPLLVIGGAKDLSVPPDQAKWLAGHVKQGTYSNYETSGHSTFAEEPERFNRDLGGFARNVLAGAPGAGGQVHKAAAR